MSDAWWEKLKLRDNAMVLMMGTKDEDMPAQPVEKTKFVEVNSSVKPGSGYSDPDPGFCDRMYSYLHVLFFEYLPTMNRHHLFLINITINGHKL